jgi:hypothetical protein
MGINTNISLVDVQLSKMEAAIENIVFLTVTGNLGVIHMMEREAASVVNCVCGGAQVDPNDGQECVPSG